MIFDPHVPGRLSRPALVGLAGLTVGVACVADALRGPAPLGPLPVSPAARLSAGALALVFGGYWLWCARRSGDELPPAEPEGTRGFSEALREGAPEGAFSRALRRRGGRARTGFTLIELLVTLVITATVFAMIGGILVSVLDATEKVDLKLRYEKAGYGALSVLRRDLAGVYAYALGGTPFKLENKEVFGKQADELRFVTSANVVPAEDGRPRPRLIEVGYRFAQADDDTLTMYRRAAPLEGDPLSGAGDYVEVLGGINAFQLEWLDGTSQEKSWQEETWDKADAVPSALRITLELALKDAEKLAAEEAGVEIPIPRYQMVVGITARVKPPDEQPAAPPAGGAPPPGG